MNKLIVRFAILSVLLVVVSACGRVAAQPAPVTKTPVTVVESTYSKQIVNGFTWAVPDGMDLSEYPIIGRKLTEAEAIRMKLRLDYVPIGTVLWNEDPKRHSFWLDTMRVDRKVWKNERGAVVYIEDCGNRAMEPLPGTRVSTAEEEGVVDQLEPTPSSPTSASSAFKSGSEFWDRVRPFLDFFAFVLLLLLIVLLGLILVRLIWGGVKGLLNRQSGDEPGPYTPSRRFTPGPAPVPPPAPVVNRAPAFAPPPAPKHEVFGVGHRGVNGEAWFGPFRIISIDDRGKEGYNVTVDGNNAGTFKQRVRSENAGKDGQWLVIEDWERH